ncbi:hypothetical protein I552_2490 [Mycobacterium xenopi 3993]|nr:hypothetical protein I552_2490 [Mycobacterium xenopi 3993]
MVDRSTTTRSASGPSEVELVAAMIAPWRNPRDVDRLV